jgi:RNA polymerase sigma-70 factor (ECF subfamily)
MRSHRATRSTNDNGRSSFQIPFPSMADEAGLLRGMLAGEAHAWRMFHGTYSGLVHTFVKRAAVRGGLQLGDDQRRDAYATLLMQLCANDMAKLRTFDPARGVTLARWLGTLAHHVAVDLHRLAVAEPCAFALEDIADEMESETLQPDEALDRKERLAQAARMLDAMSARDRELFTLCFDEGLEPEEIAARMAISVNTVYSKKHKLQVRIEQSLAAPEEIPALAA